MRFISIRYISAALFILCVLVALLAHNRHLNAGTSNGVAAGKSPLNGPYEIVGYYPSWKSATYPVDASAIDIENLTSINYAFLDICWNGKHGNSADGGEAICQDMNGTSSSVPNGAIVFVQGRADAANLAAMRSLKNDHHNLKLFVSIGGWVLSQRFSNMASDAAARAHFIASAVRLLRTYELDGIDIDWEFPTMGGFPCSGADVCARPNDKFNFVLLAREMRKALDAASQAHNKRYFLTVAAGGFQAFVQDIDGSTNWIKEIAANMDWINVMAYDLHERGLNRSSLVAPLYQGIVSHLMGVQISSVSAAINLYLSAGVPASKLVLGAPFYGYQWSGCRSGLFGDGLYQPCRKEEKHVPIDFFELIDKGFLIKSIDGNYTQGANGFVRHWNNAAQVPYLYNTSDQVFISYEDEVSLTSKSDFIKKKRLRGAMFWEMHADRYNVLGAALSKHLQR